KPEMVKENAKALFERSESPTRGDGKIKIAYFFDFNCGHCKRQTEVIKSVLKNTKEVQIIYKNFPVLGPSSEVAARAALAAHQQHKYIEFFDELQNVQQKTPEEMTKIAKKLGLDMKKWEADQNGEAVNDELNSVRELATNMKIGGTPFLAIAPDKIFPGRVDQLQEIVNTML
ncbi:MAG: DsbA family protein, partial [Bdellovibrionales bacterium]|nr:DsbA family protein [Bdellovibrionales bacterium]